MLDRYLNSVMLFVDIDAKFGKLWTYLRSKSALTPQIYSRHLWDIYGNGPFFVRDIWVVPDYKKFLHPCIDTKFSNYAKEEMTQLCWRFEEVPVSNYYPMGVKTMYRAFANDVVYELVPDLTVGSELGWKAARTHTSWGPLAKHNVHNSPIDGIHIMQRFPPFALVPTDFTPRCHDTLTSTMQYMQSKSLFGSGTVFEPTRADWEQFKANFFPWNDSVEQYVERYPDRFENPLEALVTLTFTTNRSNDNETITLHFDDDNGDSGAMRAVAEDDTHILGLHDDEEDYAADAEAYLESTIDFDATRLVTLNPAIQNQVAGHSVRHSNNGQKLPVLPYRIPIPKGVNPNARDIDLAALRMNALFQPPTEDLTELTVMELEARLVARGMAQSTVNTFKGSKFHLVCS